ncbi:MAG: transcription antitermination factor NusB [Bryobacteraceae bacterium]
MAARHRSRKRALQVLFEWDMRGESIDGAISHYYDTLYSEESEKKPKPDKFMEELARGTVAKSEEIDKEIAAKSEHWRLERMAVVDRNILRLAIYELGQQAVPPPVVIDEAIELARQFSNDESLPFINGLLDAIRRQTPAAAGSSLPDTKRGENAVQNVVGSGGAGHGVDGPECGVQIE